MPQAQEWFVMLGFPSPSPSPSPSPTPRTSCILSSGISLKSSALERGWPGGSIAATNGLLHPFKKPGDWKMCQSVRMEKGGSFIFSQHELQIDPFLAHFDGSGEETAQRPLLSDFDQHENGQASN